MVQDRQVSTNMYVRKQGIQKQEQLIGYDRYKENIKKVTGYKIDK